MGHSPPLEPDGGGGALARAARSGEPAAVDAWFRSEHPAVWRLCLGFLAEAAEADDAAQDAMLHLLDTLERWDERRSWTAWRNTLVLNICRDRTRRRAARRRAEDEALEARLPRPLPDPLDEAARRETRAALEAALARLSPREREAFVLRDLAGRATAEVAETMDVAEASVRSLLTLARRRLRSVLGPGLAAEGAAPSAARGARGSGGRRPGGEERRG